MENEQKRVIEVNGVKMEVDLRHAKTIESYKVGDPVKVLIKNYSDSYKTEYGRIIDFNEFQTLPTIVVAYIKADYSSASVEIVDMNAKTEGVQLAPMHQLEKGIVFDDIEESLDRAIDKAKNELKKQEDNKEYILKCFHKYFNPKGGSI